MTQAEQDAIRDQVDAQVTEAINKIKADVTASYPGLIVAVPRQVTVEQFVPPKSVVKHTGLSRPLATGEAAAIGANVADAAGKARK